MDLALTQIAEWLGAEVPAGEARATGYGIDSRTVRPGDLFFALRGEARDGHEFVAGALEAGAAGAVVEAAEGQPWAGRAIVVKDVRGALAELGRRAREHWAGRVVAITGSNGKTTTKEVTAALVATAFRTAKTEGNFNNELGLPLSILNTANDAEVAVWEVGMNHTGELRRLAAICQPDIGVVTNVSGAHLGNFQSVDEIALAKRELIEGLAPGGVAVLNADDARVRQFSAVHSGATVTFGIERAADVRGEDVAVGADGARFVVADGDARTEFSSPLAGRHNVYNVLVAVAVCRALGIRTESLRDAVGRLRAVKMRGQWHELDGVRVLDDTYNANPASMRAMLGVLAGVEASRRIAVLGEMREMGAFSRDEHFALGADAALAGVEWLVCVGADASPMAEGWVDAGGAAARTVVLPDAAAAGAWLSAEGGQGDAVLMKASRGIGLERALGIFRESRETAVAGVQEGR